MPNPCWVGMLTFDLCCKGPWGEGFPGCWEGGYTWDVCCKPELEQMAEADINRTGLTRGSSMEMSGQAKGPRDMNERFWTKMEQEQKVEVINSIIAPPGAPPWAHKMARCLSDYDESSSRRWFLAHSGVPAHMVSHVGNPAACIDGGHRFFWGLLVVNINLGGSRGPATMSDVALEFSICVPRSCEYAVVDAVLVPFYLGPYLGKPWGPNPEFLYRFRYLGNPNSYAWEQAIEASATTWMAGILSRGARYHHEFYHREWPFRRELWEYEPSWMPSPQNLRVLVILSAVPLLAGLILVLGEICAADTGEDSEPCKEPTPPATDTTPRRDAREEAAITARAVRAVVHHFAPQTHLKELTAPIERDVTGVHALRLLLQFLVIWQHTVLFVDWLGNGGHQGIIAFLPLTNDVARTLGRVNTTFACLTAHFSLQSMTRVLQLASRKARLGHSHNDSASRSEDCTKPATNGSAKGKRRVSPTHSPPPATTPDVADMQPATPVQGSHGPLRRSARACALLAFWCTRRWLRQVGELALWTFYFNQVTQDVPWKPFPDFVQVWYRDRTKACRRWVGGGRAQLPMWLLSLLFVYEPVNSFLRLHRPAVSLCHNMQVFENLFAVSVCAATLGVVRHCGGRWALFSVAAAVAAAALRSDPPWPSDTSPESSGSGDSSTLLKDRWDEVIYSTLNMLPAALTTAILSAEVLSGSDEGVTAGPRQQQRQRRRYFWGAISLVLMGSTLDFFAMGHLHLLADWWPYPNSKLALARGLSALSSYVDASPVIVCLLRESAHATGIAVLLRSFELGVGVGELPGWARLVSRLSLSINLTNIFAIHYLRGRLLDHPVEFSHIHGLLYTLFAWAASVVLSLIAYCMVTPYVTAAEAVLNWVSRRVVGK